MAKQRVSTQQTNEDIQIKPAGPSTFEKQKPGYKFESMFTISDLSCTIVVGFVDLTTVVSGINLHSYSKSDTLIKYSEARFSPASPEPADCIRLTTPCYYQKFQAGENSELIADDRDSTYIEALNWRNRGSVEIENLKKNLTASLPGLRYNLKATMRWERKDFWMYCTSIDPGLSYYRSKQMAVLSPSYDFMTKIQKPSEFAKQLGRDVGKQIVLDKDLKCDYLGWHIIASAMRKQSEFLGNHLITVNHGPVIYLDTDKIERLLNKYSEEHSGSIVPFVKRKMYKEQKEYRFLISVQFHSPKQDTFYLKVSDDLKNLMVPEDSV